jgi:hypothetical protein
LAWRVFEFRNFREDSISRVLSRAQIQKPSKPKNAAYFSGIYYFFGCIFLANNVTDNDNDIMAKHTIPTKVEPYNFINYIVKI